MVFNNQIWSLHLLNVSTSVRTYTYTESSSNLKVSNQKYHKMLRVFYQLYVVLCHSKLLITNIFSMYSCTEEEFILVLQKTQTEGECLIIYSVLFPEKHTKMKQNMEN